VHLLVALCAVSGFPVVSAFSNSAISLTRHGREESATTLNIAEYGRILEAVDEFYTTMPVQSAFLTCALKAHAADAIAQLRSRCGDQVPASSQIVDARIESESTSHSLLSSEFQLPRNVAFLLYGGIYQGVAQHFIYNVLFPQLFPTVAGFEMITVACKVLTDITFFGPLISLPMSFIIKSVVYGSSDPLNDGLKKYQSDILEKDLLFRYWGLWGPVNCLTFSVVPPHLRIAFVASVSFFWMICLSTLSNQGTEGKQKSVFVPGERITSSDWPVPAFSRNQP